MKTITDFIAIESSGWDECGDFGDLQLYDAKLVVDTKKFKAGDVVDTISFLFTKSICQIYHDNGKIIEEFPIKLIIK